MTTLPHPARQSCAAAAMPTTRSSSTLAFALGARWLFSRDRALLELAKPASMLGLEILTPALWSARNARLPTDSTAQAG